MCVEAHTCSFMIGFSRYTSAACKPNSGNKTLSRAPATLLQNGSMLGTLHKLLASSASSCEWGRFPNPSQMSVCLVTRLPVTVRPVLQTTSLGTLTLYPIVPPPRFKSQSSSGVLSWPRPTLQTHSLRLPCTSLFSSQIIS